MDKPLHIDFQQMGPSPALEAQIREHCAELEQRCQDIIGCTVGVTAMQQGEQHGKRYKVEVRLTLADGEIHSDQADQPPQPHADPYVAIRDSFEAVRWQLDEYAHRSRGDLATEALQHQGLVIELDAAGDGGRIETTDGRQLVFRHHSVLNDAFGALQIGDEVRFAEELGEQGPMATRVQRVGDQHPQR